MLFKNLGSLGFLFDSKDFYIVTEDLYTNSVVQLNFLFIKESWKKKYYNFHKNMKQQHNCFQHR